MALANTTSTSKDVAMSKTLRLCMHDVVDQAQTIAARANMAAESVEAAQIILTGVYPSESTTKGTPVPVPNDLRGMILEHLSNISASLERIEVSISRM